MAEHAPAWIEIGGDLAAAELDEFLLAIESHRLGFDEWAGHHPTRVDLAAVSNQGRSLRLYDDSAPFGQFEALEAFCERHQLTYRRSSDAFAEYDAEIIQCDPVGELTFLGLSTQGGEPAITLSDLQEHREAGHPLETVIAVLTRFQAPLPPFRLVPTPTVLTNPARQEELSHG